MKILEPRLTNNHDKFEGNLWKRVNWFRKMVQLKLVPKAYCWVPWWNLNQIIHVLIFIDTLINMNKSSFNILIFSFYNLHIFLNFLIVYFIFIFCSSWVKNYSSCIQFAVIILHVELHGSARYWTAVSRLVLICLPALPQDIWTSRAICVLSLSTDSHLIHIYLYLKLFIIIIYL